MNITLEQYIANPLGKSNSILNSAVRETQRNLYINKFNNVMLRENGNIKYTLYTDPKHNLYWAHLKVPSETVPKFYYDVVFKFFIDASKGGENDLFKWNVQFFSNDPSFIYTYAYVFNKNGVFITELKKKINNVTLRKEPKEKNPNQLIGYCKIIYFAYLMMQNKNINKLAKFKAEAIPLNTKKILSEVEDADIKIDDRIEKGKNVSHKKKIVLDKNTAKEVLKYTNSDTNLDNIRIKTTKTIKKLNNTNMVKTTKKVKRK